MLKKIWIKIRLFFHYLSYGIRSADNMAFGDKKDNVISGADIIDLNQKDCVYTDLLNEQVTQEVEDVRYSTYRVDRESTKYKYIGNGEVTKKNVLDEKHVDVYEDEYPIQLIQLNDLIPSNKKSGIEQILKYGKEIKEEEEHPIKIERNFIPKFKIENKTKKVVVKRVNESKVFLELYISMYNGDKSPESKAFLSVLKDIHENNNKRSDFIDFLTLKFITYKAFGCEDNHLFEYDNIEYITSTIYDGNYVLRFSADIVNDGKDILEKYYSERQEKRYKNKVQKEIGVNLIEKINLNF